MESRPSGRSRLDWRLSLLILSGLLGATQLSSLLHAQEGFFGLLRKDEKNIKLRDVSSLPQAHIPDVPPPPTVSDPTWGVSSSTLSLDDALRIALENSKVVRVLAGVTATNSGATIFDPAISNTAIDEAKGRFDPTVEGQNTFSKIHPPSAINDPLDPSRAIIDGPSTNSFASNLGVSRTNTLGGTARLGVDVNNSRTHPDVFLPLNPQTRSAVELKYTQPLLKGAGRRANLAPIVIARLNTERSFFQFKDSLQQSARGVIQAYWNLVFARTDLWARQRQVDQGEEAFRRAEARLRVGLANLAEVAQARTALANFRASMISSESNVLNQEAVLANILGLPPSGHIVPISPPSPSRMDVNWDGLLRLAEQYRPDLIELKLILEADQQMLYQARNQARPSLDAVMLYRWNGLEGVMRNGEELSSHPGQFSEWTLGVNFSVPLGLRQGRASFRKQELIATRDQANLDQGLHNATHLLALRVRNLAQYYEQYQAFREARIAARQNLDRQLENYRRGGTFLLNVLQAITDWGNSVSSESQSLTQYNAELASLEQETGTILESHGIRFFEERYRSLGPLGALGKKRCYPEAIHPGPNEPKYPQGTKPAEEFFDLRDPLRPNAPASSGVLPVPRKNAP